MPRRSACLMGERSIAGNAILKASIAYFEMGRLAIAPYAGSGPISFRCRRRLLSPICRVLSPCGDESAWVDASYSSHLHKRIGTVY